MTEVNWSGLTKTGMHAIIATLLSNTIVLFVAKQFISVPAGFQPLTLGAVAGASIIGAAGATIVYGLTKQYSDNHRKTYLYIATTALILSFYSIFAIEGQAPLPDQAAHAVKLTTTLGVLHIVSAFAAVATLFEGDQ